MKFWRIDVVAYGLLLATGVAFLIEEHWHIPSQSIGVFFSFVGSAMGATLNMYAPWVNMYKPKSVLEAKQINEQIKSTSSFFNSVAVATVAVLVLTAITKNESSGFLVAVFATIAYFIHTKARNLLSYLKDEREDGYKVL